MVRIKIVFENQKQGNVIPALLPKRSGGQAKAGIQVQGNVIPAKAGIQ